MFETLTKAPGDKILALMGEYAADPRTDKIDLGVGVYKDEKGATPIMNSVKKAEERILASGKTKTYLGIAGNKGFGTAVLDLALADAVDRKRVRIAQAPGGTGSLWVLMQLVNRARPGATIWVSDPTWPNHQPIAQNAGLTVKTYPYFDTQTPWRQIRRNAGRARQAGQGRRRAAARLLPQPDRRQPHQCPVGPGRREPRQAPARCPSSIWPISASAMACSKMPMAPARSIASVPEALVAFSGSKNFGLYRERIGAAIVIARDEAQADIVNSQMLNVIRSSYSQPPDHGAEIIRVILEDKDLRAEWETELNAMRGRMIGLREKLAEAIRQRSNSKDFDFIADHRGMFSLLGLPNETVEHLKAANGVYMIGDSRINVAGIPEDRVGDLADAMLAAIK